MQSIVLESWRALVVAEEHTYVSSARVEQQQQQYQQRARALSNAAAAALTLIYYLTLLATGILTSFDNDIFLVRETLKCFCSHKYKPVHTRILSATVFEPERKPL